MADNRPRLLSGPDRAEVDRILQLAASLPAAEQELLVRAQCGDNVVVRDESLSLLAYAGNPEVEALLETPPSLPPRLDAPRPSPPPKRAGPYDLIRRIGRGGMGDVYLAERADDRMGTQYAVKVIRAGMDTEDVLRRFELEREVLRELDHPNIARFIEAGRTDDDRPYLALEYVDGKPIDEHCDAGALGVPQRLLLFRQLCEAVGYLNRYLVVHRDIKPSNVLVTGDGTVKLLDLGVAKLLDPGAPPLTECAGRPVTLEYAAPEQVEGRPVGTSADVYALGVVLYELLTGQGPYHASRAQKGELEREILAGSACRPSAAVAARARKGNGVLHRGSALGPSDLPSIAEARGTTPDRLRRRLEGDLDQIVMKALRKEPNERYDSATRLADDVGRHLANEVISVEQTPWWTRATKFVARNRIPVGATSLVVLAAAASGVALVNSTRAAADKKLADLSMESMLVVTDAITSIDQQVEEAGRTEARSRMLERVVTQLDKLAKRAPEDPKFLLRTAETYELLGRVQGGHRGANQGDVVGAEGSYRSALSLYLAAADEEPDNVTTRLSAARTMRRLGDLHKDGDLDRALVHFTDASDYLAKIDAPAADALTIEATLATLKRARADVLVKMERFSEAETLFREHLAFCEAREGEDGSRDNRRNLGAAHMRLGLALSKQEGRLEEARHHFRENVDRRTVLLGEDPEDATLQRDYWTAHWSAAWALHEVAADLALEYLALGEPTVVALAKEFDPGNVRPQEDLALHREVEGLAHEKLGHADEAAVAFREFDQVARRLYALAEDKPLHVKMLGYASFHLGRMEDEPDAARLLLEGALARLEPLAAADPRDADLGRTVGDIGRHLAALEE